MSKTNHYPVKSHLILTITFQKGQRESKMFKEESQMIIELEIISHENFLNEYLSRGRKESTDT